MKQLTGEKKSLQILNQNISFHPCSAGRDEFSAVPGGFMCASCNIKVLKAQDYKQSEILEKLSDKRGSPYVSELHSYMMVPY